MAAMIVNNPLRAQPASESPISISCKGPVATGQYAAAQRECQFLSMTGDVTVSVMNTSISDKYGHLTLGGIAAFIRTAKTCKYTRDISRQVSTPIDAKVIDISYVNVPGDTNLNKQRFVVRALQKADGRSAGARFRLVGADDEESDDDTQPFLLAYRDVRGYYDRPITLAIAKPMGGGGNNLLCVELSIREMLVFFGGHSKKSAFVSKRCPSLGLSAWQYNPNCIDSKVSVWGDSTAYVALVDEDELKADSVNQMKVSARPLNPTEPPGLVMFQARSANGGGDDHVTHVLDLKVVFTFPPSASSFDFGDAVFSVYQPAHVAAFFGCFDNTDVAVVPSSSHGGAMIAASQRLERPPPPPPPPQQQRVRRVSRKRYDPSNINQSNVVTGRRQAVFACDLAIQRQACEDALMHDGGYLPGHPLYSQIKEELDELNEVLAEQGKPPVTDPRLADLAESRKRGREQYIEIL